MKSQLRGILDLEMDLLFKRLISEFPLLYSEFECLLHKYCIALASTTWLRLS